jgi:hypothetical protein
MEEADTTCYYYVTSDANVIFHAAKMFPSLTTTSGLGTEKLTGRFYKQFETSVSLQD